LLHKDLVQLGVFSCCGHGKRHGVDKRWLVVVKSVHFLRIYVHVLAALWPDDTITALRVAL